ncbi:brain-enriched guanylate kinase-associated protein isoform X1 [Corythoichthys intestinalis]|uniref:brain-enriched guanylate kinase-associated protein isoform X1 n=1 Tax=Corythoichthys intestinalis TaxID=161448 RepID=UPI0025A5E21F|nr:brain-enriched guanylate kinase-associated protein isoform X1 [Corythoichthys intestinalis]
MSSSECRGSLDSWSSGITFRLHNSIKKQSRAAFQNRLQEKRRWPSDLAGRYRCRAFSIEQGGGNTECHAGQHQAEHQGRGFVQSQASAKRDQKCLLEGKTENKVKFSQFLDEVTSNVLNPNSLQAFGKPSHFSSSTTSTARPHQDKDKVVTQKSWLSCSMAQQQEFLLEHDTQEEQTSTDLPPKTYLETDIDIVRRDDPAQDAEIRPDSPPPLLMDEQNLIPPPPNFCQGFEMKRFLEFNHNSHRYPFRSVSLPRGINMVCDDGMNHIDTISSLLEQKEDLRKRLSYTTHKLELLQSEFDATRQYLETELRRAQEELDKFTDKLRRIQSSYSALQRINQDLEEKIHRDSQHHDDEKRALSREIIVLNNHLMEAKLTIDKLQEDNDVYRKDCNLAAQLLQCNKSLYRDELSELPTEFQERLTMHMEESPLCHTYSDSVSASFIGQVLEKPDEACSSSQASRSPSPHTPEHNFVLETLAQGGRLGLRAAYKSDLYSSDTALYCPDDRHRERRPSMDLHGQRKLLYEPQNSTDSNPEECSVGLRPGFTQEHFADFPPMGVGSSSYSSFSGGGSEDKANDPPSSAASSPHHHTLYMDWRDAGDYERKSDSSWERDSPRGFGNNHPFQQTEMIHQQNSSSPVYSRTMSSCFSEPYEPLPPSSSPSVAYGDSRRGSALAPDEEEPIGRWRQLSAEDLSSHSYRSPGRASPYSFSEQHFSVRPAKIRLGPLYSSFQEGADYYHQEGAGIMPDPGWVATSPECSPVLRHAHSQAHLYEDSQGSEHSLYHSGNSKDREGNEASGGQSVDYGEQSPNSSTESLNHRSLEMAADLQHYQAEMHNLSGQVSPSSPPPAPPPPPPYHQKFGSLGLSRKDSLTKAQLYGTLLN